MNIHFISIGGSVMHQLAIALKRKGYTITGTDDEIFEPSKTNLQAEGLLPESMGWQPQLIHKGLDAVILGMHARADNPELLKAQQLGIPVYSFPEYIYQESLGKTRVVIGGSHGKTTTTSMIMHVLRSTGTSFDYLVGAKLQGFDQSVDITDAPVIICEGDEYPASVVEKRPKFHFLFPHIAVITGIAWDHINVFPTFENYLDQFRIFIDKIQAGGVLIYNETDKALADLVVATKRPDVRYQPYSVPKHSIENGITKLTLEDQQGVLKVFGDHNLLNMNAAYLVCRQLGISAPIFLNAIAGFTGASKRLEVLTQNANTIVFRDFAHAPSKVKATIEAVKQQFPDRRLITALELHTYSSLNADFMPHYNGALDPADEACVFYSHHAMEIKKMPELPENIVREGFQKKGLAVFTSKISLENWLNERNYHNACLLLMSSGNYDNLDILNLGKRITMD
jgi:UDP-N-acetylmuramate: L-alanyl-gamma-D-glutamyl-meso-diaminopimelate ligase